MSAFRGRADIDNLMKSGAVNVRKLAPQPRAERWHSNVIGIAAYVENPKVIAVATEVPHGQRWLLSIAGALTATTSMALTCWRRSRPQHQYQTLLLRRPAARDRDIAKVAAHTT
jgi:hypothetical protein